MGRSGDAVYRQWAILKLIPPESRPKRTSDIYRELRDEGFEVTPRTVQRDLDKLSLLFPMACHDEGPGKRWAWLDHGEKREIPGMGPFTALTFKLAEDHLSGLLPPSLMQNLKPYLDRAENVLQETSLSNWRETVRLIDHGPDLAIPPIDEGVRDTVYQALLEERQFKAGYLSRSREAYGVRQINPLGLVGREGTYYLVGCVDGKPGVRHLALHRMDKPTLLAESAYVPTDFRLDEHLKEEVAFSYPRTSTTLWLHLRVNDEVAYHLWERPLAGDQHIQANQDQENTSDLTGSVADTDALRWWLLGFGPKVRVMAPEGLKQEMADLARDLATQYGR